MTERKLVVERILPDENINLLIVGGHPADAFDNAGGTLAHHAARGDRITALVLTQGTRIHDVVIAEELRRRDRMPDRDELEPLVQERIRVKRREVQEACEIMGFSDVRFLTYEDSVLTLREEIMQEIAKVIRDVKPHIIITHYPFDNGGVADHHAITGQLVINAVTSAHNVWPEDPNPPWRAPEIYFMAVPIGMFRQTVLSAGAHVFTDVFVDTTDVIERKIRALDKIKSQQYDGPHARKRAEAVDGVFGFFMGVPYAEGFIRYEPRLYDYLPVSRYAIERANEQEAVTHARMDQTIAHTVS